MQYINQLPVLVSEEVTLVVVGIWLVDVEPKHEINQLNIFSFQMEEHENDYSLFLSIHLITNIHKQKPLTLQIIPLFNWRWELIVKICKTLYSYQLKTLLALNLITICISGINKSKKINMQKRYIRSLMVYCWSKRKEKKEILKIKFTNSCCRFTCCCRCCRYGRSLNCCC